MELLETILYNRFTKEGGRKAFGAACRIEPQNVRVLGLVDYFNIEGLMILQGGHGGILFKVR